MPEDKIGPVTLLKEQVEEKSESCKKLQEDYLRAVADFDNLRKRTQRDSEVNRRVALDALIMDLLPVLDNFERAVQASSTGATADGLRKGMDLIQKQLLEALRRHGVEEYSSVETQFDPRKAEAISFVHTSEHKPGTVVSEVSKGYSCGDRVLRPARVVVAKEIDRAVGQGPLGPSQKSEGRSYKVEVADGEDPKSGVEGYDSGAEADGNDESDTESK